VSYKDPEWMKTFHTEHITCPYCGHVDHDSWEVRSDELEFDDDEHECIDCGKVYRLSRNAKITYTSEKTSEA
jgi:transposase